MKYKLTLHEIVIGLAIWAGSGLLGAKIFTTPVSKLTPALTIETDIDKNGDNDFFYVDSVMGKKDLYWYGLIQKSTGTPIIDYNYTDIKLYSIKDGHTLAECLTLDIITNEINLNYHFFSPEGKELYSRKNCIDKKMITTMGFMNRKLLYERTRERNNDEAKPVENYYLFYGRKLSPFEVFYMYNKFYFVDFFFGLIVLVCFCLYNFKNWK